MPDKNVLKTKDSLDFFNELLYIYKQEILIDKEHKAVDQEILIYGYSKYGVCVIDIYINDKIKVSISGGCKNNEYYAPCETFLGATFEYLDEHRRLTPILVDQKYYQQIIEKLSIVFEPLYKKALSAEKQKKEDELKQKKSAQDNGKNAVFDYLRIKIAHNSSI